MACLHPKLLPNPIFGKLSYSDGRPTLSGDRLSKYIEVPCGRCVDCLSNRQNSWSFRIDCEYLDVVSKDGCSYFITLTYDDEHLPFNSDGICSLDKSHLQLFHKRLRAEGLNFRYFCCGEYGDKFGRPHYHGIYFFNEWFSKEYIHDIFYSKWLMCEDFELRVDSYSILSAEYVSKYCLKRFGVNYDGVQPPFALMSLKPAIGSSFLDNVFELRRLRQNKTLTVYDSFGNSRPLPRYFRNKIFSKIEQTSIFKKLDSEKLHLDYLLSGVSDEFGLLSYRNNLYKSSLLDEMFRVKDRFMSDFGKDCRLSYSDYLKNL